MSLIKTSTFDHRELTTIFKGVREAIDSKEKYPHYIFSNEIGSDYMDLYVVDGHRELRFTIDNFPCQRKFYSTNIPLLNIDDFIRLLQQMNVYIPERNDNDVRSTNIKSK